MWEHEAPPLLLRRTTTRSSTRAATRRWWPRDGSSSRTAPCRHRCSPNSPPSHPSPSFQQQQYRRRRRRHHHHHHFLPTIYPFKAALLVNLYQDEPILNQAFRFLQKLMDIDELMTQWRHRHALMVRHLCRHTGYTTISLLLVHSLHRLVCKSTAWKMIDACALIMIDISNHNPNPNPNP